MLISTSDLTARPSDSAETRSSRDGGGSTYRSVAALAGELGLSERSTRNALRRGEIPHIRVGRRFILPKSAIADWLRTAGRNVEAERVPAANLGRVISLPSLSIKR